VIGRLREEFNSDIPAVLITGDTAANLLQTLQESATAVVHKPLDPERLRALAQRLLAGS
jgi:CheY-like chemotaxis protein